MQNQPDPSTDAEHAKKEARLRSAIALSSPTLLGAAIILSVLSGVGSPHLLDSQVASSVALVIGAALILGSTALYFGHSDDYLEHQRNNAEQFLALIEEAPDLLAKMLSIADRARSTPSGTADLPNPKQPTLPSGT